MKRIILILILTAVLWTACVHFSNPLEPGPGAEDGNVNQYSINCYFDETEKLLKCYEHVTYYNNSEGVLRDIYMHLYPNAFEREDLVPFEPSEHISAYPEGFNAGFLNVDSVQIEDHCGFWEYEGEGRQLLRIRLPRPVAPGEGVRLDIHFTVKFPRCYGRFGYGDKTVKAANWYPIASVLDCNGWNLDPYNAIGDPFYSEVADYIVTIVLPKGFNVATTGEILKSRRYDSKNRKWIIRAEKVRDFAWVASDSFLVSRRKEDGTEIKSYYFDRAAGGKTLEFAADAITIFNECFGRYPYKTYSIVAADFFVGGMEYPNLVLISKELYNIERLFTLEYITVHETAHQWWYGMVGNDQIKEAWLDEGLTEYSTILYFEKKYGAGTAKGLLENLIKNRYESYLSAAEDHQYTKIEGTLEEYRDSEQYHVLVYCGGALIFQKLRDILGDDNFFKALRTYYNEYAFKNATTEDFIQIIEDTGGPELGVQIRGWLMLGI